MDNNSHAKVFKTGFLLMGVLAAVGLAGYALAYIIVMPSVSPTAFVPTTLETSTGIPAQFGTLQAVFVLVYAFAFLPVSTVFTVKHYSASPYALLSAGCLISVSLLIQILNSLPVLAMQLYPMRLTSISPEVVLYLRQADSIRYLAYDVAGFSLAYVAACLYAVVYFRSRRWLSYLIIGSIVAFLANVPFLWIAPNVAVTLMAVSVLAFAGLPLALAKMAIE